MEKERGQAPVITDAQAEKTAAYRRGETVGSRSRCVIRRLRKRYASWLEKTKQFTSSSSTERSLHF